MQNGILNGTAVDISQSRDLTKHSETANHNNLNSKHHKTCELRILKTKPTRRVRYVTIATQHTPQHHLPSTPEWKRIMENHTPNREHNTGETSFDLKASVVHPWNNIHGTTTFPVEDTTCIVRSASLSL